jgi:hypothetical protein
MQLLMPERGPERPRTVPEGSRAYGLGALRRELQRLSLAKEGTRNHQLNAASFNMGRLVAAGGICEQEAAAALIEQGQRIGLGLMEYERTVASGLSAGMEQPRAMTLSAESTIDGRGGDASTTAYGHRCRGRVDRCVCEPSRRSG